MSCKLSIWFYVVISTLVNINAWSDDVIASYAVAVLYCYCNVNDSAATLWSYDASINYCICSSWSLYAVCIVSISSFVYTLGTRQLVLTVMLGDNFIDPSAD